MDDSFPDVSVDNTNSRQRVLLNGSGSLEGIIVMRDIIHAMKFTEDERYDLQSGIQEVFPVDFYSRDSLAGIGDKHNPAGVVYAGVGGLYYLPASSGASIILNPLWLNLYNGQLLIDDESKEYIDDTMRTKVLAGYDRFNQAVWIQIQKNKDAVDGGGTEYLNYVAYFENNAAGFYIRELNLSSQKVEYFTSRNDGTFTIGYKYGLLGYPNLISSSKSHAYEDEVNYLGVSMGRGIPTRLRFNVGEVFGLSEQTALWSMLLEHKSHSANAAGKITVNFYANGSSVPFTAHRFIADERFRERVLKSIGQVKQLQVEIVVPASETLNVTLLELSQIELLLTSYLKVGNQ
jgi:hypothetical protein